jgi:hypothetical protein
MIKDKDYSCYGLTEKSKAQDKCPDWMDKVVNREQKTQSDVNSDDIKKIFSTISKEKTNKKCSKCGAILNTNEISTCKNCRKK